MYVQSEKAQQRLYKRTLFIVILSQTFGGAGLAAGITVGALLAQEMLGSTSVSGLPTALFTLGSALAAYLVGHCSQRFGRRYGLAFGFLAGGIGAIGVVVAGNLNSVILLFISLFIYGAGTSTNLQARYAGTDLAKPKQRGKAVSIAMVATTLGAVAGPNLVTPTGHVAEALGMPALTGPFILAAAAYILAGLTFLFFLKPDPFLVAKAIASATDKKEKSEEKEVGNISRPAVHRLGIFSGATVLILTHMVMIAIMTMTPIHMQNHGSGLSMIGLIIGLHIAAMFLPSPITGALVDRFGPTAMVIASGVTLFISGIMAAFTPGDAIVPLAIALILLGLGWNFGLISGTAMIIESTSISSRAKTQGSVDVWVALSGSAGGLLSGIIVAASSYAVLGYLGGYLALLLVPLIFWIQFKERKTKLV
ncbi:MFS transporter [Bacillus sp. B15-48]|uniref:MFS transporter n=1 Tax=Bacillus sp. B15-48 TaxID=1548601 RepID=UPI00193EF9AC|nr:MFS transporter [Bacillus sp. B15-48]MBM4764385.1 MFS transporter [Bacillus sp. B15-48]